MVEEDGDEVFTPMEEVRCCRIGFEGDKPVYSTLIAVERAGHIWMCCDTCGASYGEAPAAKPVFSEVDLHNLVSLACGAKQAPHVYNQR